MGADRGVKCELLQVLVTKLMQKRWGWQENRTDAVCMVLTVARSNALRGAQTCMPKTWTDPWFSNVRGNLKKFDLLGCRYERSVQCEAEMKITLKKGYELVVQGGAFVLQQVHQHDEDM